MALSMDEQRRLAEIGRRLAAEDPGLAARLSSFKRPGPSAKLRSPRSKIIGSVFAVAAALVLSMMVYAMIPFRAHVPRGGTSPQATGGASVSAPAKPGRNPAAGSAHAATAASTGKAGAAARTAGSGGPSGTHSP
jgi:hypothetical protein